MCKPKILVFDLKTNKLLKKYEIPTVISQNSKFKGLLVNLVVRTSGPTCESVEVRKDFIFYIMRHIVFFMLLFKLMFFHIKFICDDVFLGIHC